MNSERIRILAHIYRNHYEEWADSAYNPCGRFAAALVCRRYFNPDAEDLAAMLDRAFGPAESFLEKDDEKPLQGLSFLCRNGHEEEVRRAFILLLGEDGGSIDDRMEKIHEFAETCNRLLEDTAPDRWELRQRLWSGLDYLALIRPEQDFFFRAPEVIAFAGYIEAEEEIGYDRFLNLVNYYRLAEDTAAELAGENELLKLVRRRLEQYGKEHALEGLEDVDSNLHLLAFDLIQAVYAMDWYSEKSAKRKSRISTVAQRRIDKMQKAAALLEERDGRHAGSEAISGGEKGSGSRADRSEGGSQILRRGHRGFPGRKISDGQLREGTEEIRAAGRSGERLSFRDRRRKCHFRLQKSGSGAGKRAEGGEGAGGS